MTLTLMTFLSSAKTTVVLFVGTNMGIAEVIRLKLKDVQNAVSWDVNTGKY